MYSDPWANIKTCHGCHADEVISALQKTIRRGLEEDAVRFAYEMYMTSKEMEDYLWLRLKVISVEDIGLGNPQMPVLIHSLDCMRKDFLYGSGDRMIFAVHAVRCLCRSEKTRSNDLLRGVIKRELDQGKPINIPDAALDMHTMRGRAMGRGLKFFLEEASKVVPAANVDEPDYWSQLMKNVKE